MGPDAQQICGSGSGVAEQLCLERSLDFRQYFARTEDDGAARETFLKFNAICSLGIILNIVILNIEFNMFHVNRYLANFIAIGLVTLWNYKSNKEFSWRVTSKT